MVIGVIIALLLIYAAWLIRCIQNAQEEKTEMEEIERMEVSEQGQLNIIHVAKFHTV